MKAVQINSYGGYKDLEINDVALPSIKTGYLIVDVFAASINPFDWRLRSGLFKKFIPLSFPATLGGDFAGVVTSVAEDEKTYEAGDEVYGTAIILNGGSGAFAQKARVNTKYITIKPNNINFLEAASLPLVGTSTIQALEDHLKLQKGQKILIHGGTGGIGSIAIQLAKFKGALVSTTVSTKNKDFAKKIGADIVIDYKTEHFWEKIRNFDAAFDTVGGETTQKSLLVLKKGGTLVSMVGTVTPEDSEKYGVKTPKLSFYL